MLLDQYCFRMFSTNVGYGGERYASSNSPLQSKPLTHVLIVRYEPSQVPATLIGRCVCKVVHML